MSSSLSHGERRIAGVTAQLIVAKQLDRHRHVQMLARAYIELIGQVQKLHDRVDQTDPHDPIGVALTEVGLADKPAVLPTTGPRLVPTPLSPEQIAKLSTEQIAEIYRRVMDGPDLAKHQTFIVRHWDGMDGCWTDHTGDISRDEALRYWAACTEGGTRNTKYEEIDYYRIFPGGTHMLYDGSEGGEMHR